MSHLIVVDQLADELRWRRGTQTYQQFAQEIGTREGMLRAYLTGRSDAGIDTLAAILAWDLEDSDLDVLFGDLSLVTQLTLRKILSRGKRVREEVAA